ncbi:class I SAM-dependent methyltransferase [Williamsia sterculiae]|uniref:class I SAM-dependent methyltransferase n=1 Tax=Williamsia sterculiae TaxID=1344003 RepID=UPI0009FB184D|nr:class I SAM-dependent methyltransferase [Williamsia sterculiae]
MTETDPLARTRRDYDRVADIYDDMVRHGREDALATGMITAFATLVSAECDSGVVLNAGCGPGHWTDWLDRFGVSASGVDLSPGMIDIARRYRPDLSFEIGSLLGLPAVDATVQGVLAHFSVIPYTA